MGRKKGSRSYPQEFKRRVAGRALSSPSIAAVARRHGLNANMAHLWCKDDRFGGDLTTVEGRLAATAYALVHEGISSGGYPVLPKTFEYARIEAEAAALFELMHPGTIVETEAGGAPAKQRALQGFIEDAGEAYSRGDLRHQDGDLAQGWVEVFPELTEEERRLRQLPGFTPKRIEQWLEICPIEVPLDL